MGNFLVWDFGEILYLILKKLGYNLALYYFII